MKIVICFFGITRSLSYTIKSIIQNVVEPSRKVADVRIYAHFFRQPKIFNPRSGENGSLAQDEHNLLNPDWIELEEPELCLVEHHFHKIMQYGDAWNDDLKSLRNLIHQQHSLQRVATSAIASSTDIFLFIRPDIQYLDSFLPVLQRAQKVKKETIFLPNWAHWGPGFNDRFSVCVGKKAAYAYAMRLNNSLEFCESFGALHAEKLLKYSVKKSGVNVEFFSVRGSRVRSNGDVVCEDFRDYRILLLRDYRRSIVKLVQSVVTRS